jgi:hypothetical protein
MKLSLLLAACLAALPLSLAAEPIPDVPDCTGTGCPFTFSLRSLSDLGQYGLLIAAPDSGCKRVRFRVESEGGSLLGQTPPLAAGELALIRFGQRFAEGDHALTIAADGCDTHPAATRRVTLRKTSPDHGWRAAG